MASNTQLNAGSGGDVVTTKERTHDGDATKQQVVSLAGVTGTEGAYTHTDIQAGAGTAANALRVELPTDGTGKVGLNAGTNNIGDVDVLTLPALPAGTNNIGDVDVLTVPADPFGANADAASASGSISAKLRQIATNGIPVSTALPAGSNAIGKLAANSGVDIGDVDVLSVVPGTGATNLGKAEDAAHASGDTGVLALAVRQDSDATMVSATGDYSALQVDANGYLKVNIKAGAGSGGTAAADGSAFTRGTTSLTPAGAVVETSAPTLTNGQVAALSQTTGGALRVAVASGGVSGQVEDAASAGGEEGIMVLAVRRDSASSGVSANGDFAALSVDSNGALRVTGGGGGTQYAEDAAHASGDTGTLGLAVRQDTLANSTSADGDYAAMKVNNVGRLYTTTTIDAALPTGSNVIGALSANQSVNIAQMNGVATTMGNGVSGTGVQRVTLASDSTGVLANVATIGTSVTPGTSAAHLGKAEDAAAASGDTGVAVLAVRRDSPSSNVSAAGDYATLQVDANGSQWVRSSTETASIGGCTPFRLVSAASTNATSLKGSAGKLNVLVITNKNAAPRTVKFYNKATAPTVGTDTPVLTFEVPGNTAGAGMVVPIPPQGIAFSTGIAYAITTENTDAGTTAVAAGDIVVTGAYT